jgi:hypothetical protein
MSYYSNSMSPTAQATPPIYYGPLSPAAPLSGFSKYSPYSLGLTFYPAVTAGDPTLNPYADNFLPATVQQLMPCSSWVNPIDDFAAALPIRHGQPHAWVGGGDCEPFRVAQRPRETGHWQRPPILQTCRPQNSPARQCSSSPHSRPPLATGAGSLRHASAAASARLG